MNLSDSKKPPYTNIIQLAKELLSDGYFIQVCVGGYSMFPFLQRNDTVLIKKEPFNSLKKGDIIVFLSVNKLIAHRIIAIRKMNSQITFITKGDSHIYFDRPITEDRYFGKITEFRRKNKLVTLDAPKGKLINKMFVLISLISIPFFIILIPLMFTSRFFKTHLIINKKQDLSL